ncbi:E3 ubiquitin-protein ligase SP1-like [Anneissia japonica]|uniref:E3 ubiquitin-protein ligase SP1-like n=1 Tax=Anneissia japonica TaxID=1529436 RepID=UPI001425BA6C|nr:E3 ubiquitin-protein ligase SP1-like [Anneissia japonica]XP_033098634.1 E3 ubiquitin-protein ligase SP1-like [Anneissia japonica]
MTMVLFVVIGFLLVISPFVYIKYLWWKLENSQKSANDKIEALENEIKTHIVCIQLLQKDITDARVELQDLDRIRKENTSLEETLKSLTEENGSLSSELMTIKHQKAIEFIQNLEMEKKAAQRRESEYSKRLMDEQASLKERLHEIDELKQQAEDSKLCVICGEDERSLVFMPCGHCCSCKMCYTNLPNKLCPMCRKGIRSTQSIYM